MNTPSKDKLLFLAKQFVKNEMIYWNDRFKNHASNSDLLEKKDTSKKSYITYLEIIINSKNNIEEVEVSQSLHFTKEEDRIILDYTVFRRGCDRDVLFKELSKKALYKSAEDIKYRFAVLTGGRLPEKVDSNKKNK
jgi:hypothetical protein